MPHTELLESGDVAVTYRPRVVEADAESEPDPRGPGDVQNVHLILRPHGQSTIRLLVVGGKRLPEVGGGEGEDRLFAFVDTVFDDPEELHRALAAATYQTETRGQREQPAARPAGEGVYGVVRHDDHTHLAVELELPEQRGVVQKELRVPQRGGYVLTVKHPEAPTPQGAGLGEHQQADYPEWLEQVFGGRRWTSADPTDLLDHPGAEINLIAADEDPAEELHLDLDALGVSDESAQTADVFQTLRLRRRDHPADPLFGRQWA